jgi:lipopolysaccharide biosynthesis protein
MKHLQFSSFITKAWWNLPLSRQNKELLKTLVFSVFPFFFRRSKAYHNWKDARFQAIDKGERSASENYVEGQRIFSSDNGNIPKIETEPGINEPITSIAIVIHAFYYEIFLEILDYLHLNRNKNFKLYVTSPQELSGKIISSLKINGHKFSYLPVGNRGRDILPFLKIIAETFNDGHQLILKIHTKKSDHRQTGDLWRKDIFKKLLTEKAMQKAISTFNLDKSIGLMGAAGHIVPMSLYYGANAKTLERLSQRMGVAFPQLAGMNFAAGSMFYARKQALLPLLSLGLNSGDFEDEQAQNDGTLAHAIERVFAVSAFAAGLKLVDNSFEPSNPILNITKDHPYTY